MEVLESCNRLRVALREVTETNEDTTVHTVVRHDVHEKAFPGGAVERRDGVGRQIMTEARGLVVCEGEA